MNDHPAGGPPELTEDDYYRLLAASLPDVVVLLFGPDLRFRLVAGAGVTRFGWDRQRLLGRLPSEALDSAVAATLGREMARALAGETPSFLYRRADPDSLWTITVSPVAPEGGDAAPGAPAPPVAGMIVAREVSSLRDTELARRQAEERFAVALDAAPVFVFAQDADLRFTWMNKTTLAPHPDDIVGRTDFDLLAPETARVLDAAKRRVLRTGAGERLLLRDVAAAGTRFLDVTLQPAFGEGGEPNGIVGAALDVTEIKASEERLQAALETVLDAVTIQHPVRDADGTIVDFRIGYATSDAVDFAGRGPDELVGRTVHELYPLLKDAGVVGEYARVLATGEPLRVTALPYSEVPTRHYDLVASRLGPEELMVVWRDVTDRELRRQSVVRLEAARAVAEELQRALLPATLPEFPGLELAAAYRPASAGADIGGDWYDAFPAPLAGAVTLIVGDVAGHDGQAAALMARMSSVIRAEASRQLDPAAVLAAAERFLLALDVEKIVTVVIAVLAPETGRMTLCSAGHPPPVIATPGRPAEILPVVPGPPLGAGPAARCPWTGSLPPGGTLLLYTDGLLDPGIDVDTALAGLATSLDDPRLADLGFTDLPTTVAGLVDRTAAFAHTDDAAALAARRSSPPPP
jgi:PAS domain S-box-containing protein